MTDRELPKPRFTELHDVEQDNYRAVSGLAVAGLVLGLLSVAALVDHRAAVVSVAAALTSGLALWRIARRSPELIGRKAALVGLVLSLTIGCVAVGHVVAYRLLLVRQSREVAAAWFDLIANGQPQVAYQFHLRPDDRLPAGTDLWKAYCSDQTRYQNLTQYVAQEGVRALLALGKNVTIRPYAIESVDTRNNERLVVALYSATFDQKGQKTTFLVRVMARRLADDTNGRAVWQLIGVDSGVRPAWEGEENWLTTK